MRQRLRDGPPVVASFQLIPRVEIVELLASAGFDATILDFEHGSLVLDDAVPLVAAAHGAGIFALARVPDAGSTLVGRLLDVGVDGIVAPHVDSASRARRLVEAGRFAPDGHRGANPWVRAGVYSADQSFLTGANARVALIAMVEGPSGLMALDDIVSVEHLDGVFVGPVDLSVSLGVPGQTEHPKVLEGVRRVFTSAAAAGLTGGAFASTPEAAARWLDLGARLVALSVDTGMVLAGFTGYRSALTPRGKS